MWSDAITFYFAPNRMPANIEDNMLQKAIRTHKKTQLAIRRERFLFLVTAFHLIDYVNHARAVSLFFFIIP